MKTVVFLTLCLSLVVRAQDAKTIYVGWWDHSNGEADFELYNNGEADNSMQWALPGTQVEIRNISQGRHPKFEKRIRNSEAAIRSSTVARKVRYLLSKKEEGDEDFQPIGDGIPISLNTGEGYKVSHTWTIPEDAKPTTVYKIERWLGDGTDWYWWIYLYPRGAEIVTLEFTSDHNLICDGDSVTTAGNRFPDVEWEKDESESVNAPITHTASKTEKLAAKLKLNVGGVPDDSAYTLKGTSTEQAYTFKKTGNLSNGEVTLELTAENPIGEELRKIDEAISWTLEVAGTEFDLGDTGSHVCFTTLGTPDISLPAQASVPNVSRMEVAVPRVETARKASTCNAGLVHEVVKNTGPYDLRTSLTQVQAWTKPTVQADCISIARFAHNVCAATGVPGSFESKTYIAYYRTQAEPNRPDEGVEGNLDRPVIKPGDKGVPLTAGLDANWELALADSNTTNGGGVGGVNGINVFEAAVVYTDGGKTWYMPAGVRNDPIYDKPELVVRIFKTMVWVALVDHDNDPLTRDKWQVQKVEWTYNRPQDVNPCP